MPTPFERRLNELEPIDLETAARAYAATLLEVDETPRRPSASTRRPGDTNRCPMGDGRADDAF